MPVQTLVALLLSTVYALLSLLHVYWAFGGRLGLHGVIPEVGGATTFQPSRRATLLVACALAAASTLLLCRSGVVATPLPAAWLRAALYALASVFALRAIGDFRVAGFFKRVRGTAFARLDTWLFSPLCAALASAIFWLAYV